MRNIVAFVFILMMFMLTSCEIVGDIFSAGFYTGLFVVLAVVALIIWLVAKMGKRG
jgi:hypothetical protein